MRKIDFHVHILNDIPVEKSVEYFKDMSIRHGYDGVGIMSLINSSYEIDLNSNNRALQIKEKMPGSYAFAALDHNRDFVEQTKEYMCSGFDGIKLLEGKPSIYRYYGYGLDCERFDRFFEYAQHEQVPVLIHNCDPAQNWDINKVDNRAIEQGWYYDENTPPQSFFFETFERVLEKYPNIRMAVAHMGFYSDNLEKAAQLLEHCPNLYFDITPALLIYSQLSQQQNAREFFEKYGDRLIYGTDAENDLTGFKREYNDKKVRVITAFLENESPCTIDGIDIVPIGANKALLQKIYADNALEFIRRK